MEKFNEMPEEFKFDGDLDKMDMSLEKLQKMEENLTKTLKDLGIDDSFLEEGDHDTPSKSNQCQMKLYWKKERKTSKFNFEIG